MDKVFMETAVQSRSLVAGDGVKELLERHLAEVDVLSKLRANEKNRLQQKLKEKLAQRDRQNNAEPEEDQRVELQVRSNITMGNLNYDHNNTTVMALCVNVMH